MTVSPLKVFKETTKVNLPTATSVPDVTISWTDLPEGYINDEESSPDFGKVLKRESENTEVTLTATATDGSETKTKDFTITIYPATAVPSAQDLADSLTFPSAVSQDIDLPNTVAGYPAAAITWTSADDNIIKIEDVSGQKKGSITYDLIDKTVTLTASIHYEDGNPDTLDDAQAQFNITVTHVVKITEEQGTSTSTDEFTGSEYIKIRTDKATGKIVAGSKYTYTDVQTAADGTKTALFTQTARYDAHKEKWVTAQEYIEEQTGSMNQGLAVVQELKTKNPLTLRDFIPLIRIMAGSVPDDITDEQIFDSLKGALPLSGTYANFMSLPPTEQTAKLKAGIGDFEAMTNQFLASFTPETAFSLPARYKYRFERFNDGSGEKLRFVRNIPYNPAEPWYEQRGVYRFLNSASPVPAGEIMGMDLSVRERDQNQYEASIDISISDGTNSEQAYRGETDYTPNAAEIAVTLQRNGGLPGPDITVKISGINVDAAGKMTANVQIGSDPSQSLTLQFEGHSLQ